MIALQDRLPLSQKSGHPLLKLCSAISWAFPSHAPGFVDGYSSASQIHSPSPLPCNDELKKYIYSELLLEA